MFDVGTFILGALIVLAVIGIGAAGLWLGYGRKKKAEDKAIGMMEQMAHYKATSSVDGIQRRTFR